MAHETHPGYSGAPHKNYRGAVDGSCWGSIELFRRANTDAGYHWFDLDTLRFFKSRVGEMLPGDYFISSERGPDEVRRYTLRVALPDGRVGDASEFQAFVTRSQALAFYRKLRKAQLTEVQSSAL